MPTTPDTHYLDPRGIPWTITTYDVPQWSTGTKIIADTEGYPAHLGASSVDDAVAEIESYARTHNRRRATLDAAHRHTEDYGGHLVKFDLVDSDKHTWPVYRIDRTPDGRTTDGAVGYYAANAEQNPSAIVGPSDRLLTLQSDLKEFRAKTATSAAFGTADEVISIEVSPAAGSAEATPTTSVFSRPLVWFGILVASVGTLYAFRHTKRA